MVTAAACAEEDDGEVKPLPGDNKLTSVGDGLPTFGDTSLRFQVTHTVRQQQRALIC